MEYGEMYNIFNGVYLTFEKTLSKKMLTVKHSQKKRDQVRNRFPVNKYSSYSKDMFMLATLYINLVRMPTSVDEAITMLDNVTKNDIIKFKDSIIQYNHYLKEDIALIESIYGTNVTFNEITTLYRQNKINWYTWYFYIEVANVDINALLRTRINSKLYKRVKTMLLFVNFKESSKDNIKILLTNNIRF